MWKMKTPTVKMETVTLIGKSRYHVTCFVCKVFDINGKIFFLSRHLFLRGHLRCG